MQFLTSEDRCIKNAGSFLRNPPIAFRLLVGVRPSQGMTTTHHERLHPRTCPHEVLLFCDFEGIEVVGSTHLASPLRKSQDFHVEKGHLQLPEVSAGQHNSIHMRKLSPLPQKYDDYSNDYTLFSHATPASIERHVESVLLLLQALQLSLDLRGAGTWGNSMLEFGIKIAGTTECRTLFQ